MDFPISTLITLTFAILGKQFRSPLHLHSKNENKKWKCSPQCICIPEVNCRNLEFCGRRTQKTWQLPLMFPEENMTKTTFD